MAEKGDDDGSRRGTGPSETSAPRVPHFDELDSAEQEAFGLSYALLGYNLDQMHADQPAHAAVASATDELVQPPAHLLAQPPASRLDSNSFGRRLRQIADSFRDSRHADGANLLADGIRLDSVTYETFKQTLRQLFSEGYNIEAFVTLFHFLARLLMRCWTENGSDAFQDMCRCLVRWFLSFLLTELIGYVVDYVRQLPENERNNFLLGCAAGATGAAAFFLLGLYLMRKS